MIVSAKFRPRAAVFAWLAILAGCTSPNPNLYTISVQPGATLPGGPKIIELRDIGLARYLDRLPIVRSSEGYRIDIMANDTWGEPLGAMLGRVLVIELDQRLPGSNVYGDRGAISLNPDATLAVDVQRLDLDQTGELVLLAQAVVEFRHREAPVAQTFHITRPVSSATTEGEVAAISAAVGELADGLALMLRP